MFCYEVNFSPIGNKCFKNELLLIISDAKVWKKNDTAKFSAHFFPFYSVYALFFFFCEAWCHAFQWFEAAVEIILHRASKSLCLRLLL